ncbi:iron chaperone [Isobaculum melis]|uniref:YdhG-like domain-containing protein n=1 Tax=Isobaculum melis TaxID=142588 RepID=A0A1H9PV52_9LACT|nr:iron chaperone [Isobaculum melis]SER52000.1 hypothetical protein SAMN04488559_101155 [Isobaculum melis]
METFADYLATIDQEDHRARTEEVLNWVMEKFPDLKTKIAWNQPMFTDHETFILGFSVSKKHLAVSPEAAGITHFSEAIQKAGYDHTKNLLRFPWEQPIDYSLLEQMIQFNRLDKADCSTFWRK